MLSTGGTYGGEVVSGDPPFTSVMILFLMPLVMCACVCAHACMCGWVQAYMNMGGQMCACACVTMHVWVCAHVCMCVSCMCVQTCEWGGRCAHAGDTCTYVWVWVREQPPHHGLRVQK